MKQEDEFCIGQLIKEYVEREGISAEEFGKQICCQRANVYKLFNRYSIDTAQLGLISRVLNHNFFDDIANNEKLSGVDDEQSLKEIQDRMAVAQFVEVMPKVLLRYNVEYSIVLGRPKEVSTEIPLPEYYLSPYNITFSVGDLLYNKKGVNLKDTAKVTRMTLPETHVTVDLWEFLSSGMKLLNMKIEYKTEQEWEIILDEIFKFFYGQYNIIKQ